MRTIEEVTKDIANYWIHNLSNSEIKTADDECNYLKSLLNEILEIHKEEKRPSGKWLATDEKYPDDWHCSCCGAIVEADEQDYHDWNYCYHCGADMRESEEI